MATLTRIQNLISRRSSPAPLDSHVPSPFPSLRDRHVQTGEILDAPGPIEPLPAPAVRVELAEEQTQVDQEILPSLLSVEQSSLMALNNLFSGILSDDNWRPIVPPRRHSLPSFEAPTSVISDSTPLYTLVSNLRLQRASDTMIQASDEPEALLRELGQHVEHYSVLMDTKDARMARLLVSLLQFSARLAQLAPAPASLLPPNGLAVSQNLSDTDVYDNLSRQASSIQLRLHGSMPAGSTQGSSVSATERAMVWAQVDHILGDIQNLCHQRALPSLTPSPYYAEEYDRNLPPEYDHEDYQANPPVYETPDEPFAHLAPTKEKSSDEQSLRQGAPSHRESMISSEKLKLDLDSVLMAIDRLYIVAPQLSNQRVELKGRKLEQMEFARVAGAIEKLVDSGRLDDQRAVYRPTPALSKGKQRLEDQRDLDNLMSLIGQAASRTMDSQTFYVDDMQARLARARQKDDAKRDAFVTQLMQHSSHGRMHSQDAVAPPARKERKSPNVDVVVESVHDDDDLQAETNDPNTMMTLPEFVKSHPGPSRKSPSPDGLSHPGSPRLLKKPSKLGLQSRGRSNSAPPLAWLTGKSASSRSPLAPQTPSSVQMHVKYVAEYRESLNLIAVQLRVDGVPRTSRLEAEIASSFDESSLVLQCGSTNMAPLSLPAYVPAGKVDLFTASMGKPVGAAEYLDLKLITTPSADERERELEHELPKPLDAERLRTAQPSSFVCASCSLPVVQGIVPGDVRYGDLPSEHWAELLDAWMCHPDQKVSAELAKRAEGIWPAPGQILVGGSFLLFHPTMVNVGGLIDCPGESNGEWHRVQCLCGASIGHRQDRPNNSTTYRFKKYTVRPIAVNHRFPRVPFSAFVAGDMVELAQAHASYRFVIQDEETEMPRILIWLFKPSIRLSYAGAAGSLIPANGTITAAKVTFVILGPGGPINSLNRYPAFKNAEVLSYPMDLCRRLAASLKESNAVYPEARRTLDGMSIGWLQRT